MLWIIAITFLVLWALGLVTSFTLGGWIHVLVAVALVLVIVRLFEGRPYGFRHGGHHPT
ncbi:MAG TPA: lmo0937 family membrane protein [Propionicimonas sp.]|jgi:hypothetical protein